MEAIKVVWVGLLMFTLSFPAYSQEKKTETNVELGKVQDLIIEFDTIPDSVGAGGKSGISLDDVKAGQEGRWLRIEAPFSTKKKFTPEVKFKFYVEGYEVVPVTEGGKKEEKYVVLAGEAVYRDVPGGKKQYAVVFLSPASVLRFAGLKSGGEQDWPARKMNVKVEAFEGGSPVEGVLDLLSEKERDPRVERGGKKDPDWNKSSQGQEITGALLPIYDTPFWPKDYKRYPQPRRP
jgi:hypothetical protein